MLPDRLLALLGKELQGSERVQLNRRLFDWYFTPYFKPGSVWGGGYAGDPGTSWLFQRYEFNSTNLPSLIWLLQSDSLQANELIWERITAVDRQKLSDDNTSVAEKLDILSATNAGLNLALQTPTEGGIRGSLFREQDQGLDLSPATQALLKRTNSVAQGNELVMLNRLILDDFFNVYAPQACLRGPNWAAQRLTGFRLHYALSDKGSRTNARLFRRDFSLNDLHWTGGPANDDNSPVLTFDVSWSLPSSEVCWASVSALIEGGEGNSSFELGPVLAGGRPWNGALYAVAGYRQVYLYWDEDPLIAEYELRYTTDPDTNHLPDTVLARNLRTTRFWHDANLNPALTYRYQVIGHPYDPISADTQSTIVPATPLNDASRQKLTNCVFEAFASPYDNMALIEWTIPRPAGAPIVPVGSQTNWQFFVERKIASQAEASFELVTEMSYGPGVSGQRGCQWTFLYLPGSARLIPT